MVLTHSQYENTSKGKLIHELTDINSRFFNDNAKFTGLLKKLNEFTRFTRNCSSVKALILIFSKELFNWSTLLLQTFFNWDSLHARQNSH